LRNGVQVKGLSLRDFGGLCRGGQELKPASPQCLHLFFLEWRRRQLSKGQCKEGPPSIRDNFVGKLLYQTSQLLDEVPLLPFLEISPAWGPSTR
jgi:hypothetical protein